MELSSQLKNIKESQLHIFEEKDIYGRVKSRILLENLFHYPALLSFFSEYKKKRQKMGRRKREQI